MDIDELAGVAVGCIGMSLDDFEQCTPSAFYEIWKRWNEVRCNEEMSAWNRTRITVLAFLQPWSKKTLDPCKIMPLPWDKEKEQPHENLNDEDMDARFEAAKKRYGLK